MPGGVSELFNIGFGFTVTVICCTFLQPLAVNVSIYTTGMGLVVVLINTSLIVSTPLAAAFDIPVTTARLQLKVVPAVALAGMYVNNVLSQMAGGASDVLNVGAGFTVTETVCINEHPFAVSVYM